MNERSSKDALRVRPLKQCPYCKDGVVDSAEEIVACATCHAPQHRTCWDEHGGCTAGGCHETSPLTRAREQNAPKALRASKETKQCVPITSLAVYLPEFMRREFGRTFEVTVPPDGLDVNGVPLTFLIVERYRTKLFGVIPWRTKLRRTCGIALFKRCNIGLYNFDPSVADFVHTQLIEFALRNGVSGIVVYNSQDNSEVIDVTPESTMEKAHPSSLP